MKNLWLKALAIHPPTIRRTKGGKVVPVKGFTEGHRDARPRNSQLNKPVTSARMEEIATRPDLMQFKRMENTDGTNSQDAIKGKWNDLYSGVITVWKPEDPKQYGLKRGEKYIVVNGHHRLAHAKSYGVKSLRVQVLHEGKGPDKETSNYTPLAARRVGAEINIVDGKGSIYDAVKFLRDQRAVVGKDRALERARDIGISGGQAAAIGFNAKDSLSSAFFSERITPQQAFEIASAALGDDDLQRAGIKVALSGKQGPALFHYIMAIRAMNRNNQEQQFDLFGNSDAAIVQAEQMAETAARIQRQIKDRIASAAGAARRPDQAKELGVDVQDTDRTQRELIKLKTERDKWDKWYLYPTLIAQAKGEAMKKSIGFLPLIKSHVTAHTRLSSSGKASFVNDYNDRRQKRAIQQPLSRTSVDIPTALKSLSPALREKCRRAAPGQGGEIKLLKLEVHELLMKGTYGLLSAGKNPKSQLDQSLNDNEIGQRYDSLKKDLKAKGLKWISTKGKYEDEEESLWVLSPDITRSELADLGGKYNQDSVIYSEKGKNEMIFTTGQHKGERYEGTGFDEVPDAEDYYTEVKTPHSQFKFTLHFDFNSYRKAMLDFFNELRKAHVSAYSRKTPEGRMVFVPEHTDTRPQASEAVEHFKQEPHVSVVEAYILAS